LLGGWKRIKIFCLVDQQLRRLEQDFLQHGGLRERMTSARLKYGSQTPNP
jgi:four helix bundle suffix protein